MGRLFVSHSSNDDAIVRTLQQALGELDQDVWIDSRHLHGGDPLWQEIRHGIEEAEAYAVVVSRERRVVDLGRRRARSCDRVQQQRDKDAYPVIPLSLDAAVRPTCLPCHRAPRACADAVRVAGCTAEEAVVC